MLGLQDCLLFGGFELFLVTYLSSLVRTRPFLLGSGKGLVGTDRWVGSFDLLVEGVVLMRVS